MSTPNTMTTREFFEAVINANISEAVTGKATSLLAALDARNEKRKSADSKEKREAAYKRLAVLDFLSAHKGESFTRDAIAEAVTIKVGEAQSAALALVREGKAVKAEVKIDKARRVVYTLAE